MPRLSVWMIRAAMLYFGVGFTFGALMLLNKGIAIEPTLWRLLPMHIEFLLFGWTVQLAVGVGYWILPRFSGGVRGNEKQVWVAFILFNAGVLVTGIGQYSGWPPMVLVAARLCQLTAAILIGLHFWPRVKAFG